VPPDVAPHLVGPWPDGREVLRTELDAYLAEVGGGRLDPLATRCPPWSVRDVTTHLAETFARFGRMLAQGRTGDFAPPFPASELDAENLRAVAEFEGDPARELRHQAEAFVGSVDDLEEPMPHQLGTIPAGLQVLFGVMDLAMHHDDVAVADGRGYHPPGATIAAILPVAQRLFGMPEVEGDPWPALVAGSGRTPG
jgi:uncharacterized protein (TIGR03083 family)